MSPWLCWSDACSICDVVKAGDELCFLFVVKVGDEQESEESGEEEGEEEGTESDLVRPPSPLNLSTPACSSSICVVSSYR